MNCPGQHGSWSGTEDRARLGGTCDRLRYAIATVRQDRGRAFFVVAVHVQVLVVGAAIREPVSQTRVAAVGAGTGSQPRFEEHDRASQVSICLSNGSSNLSMRSSVLYDLSRRCMLTVPQQPARLIRNGQARGAMLVKFPARFFNRLARPTTGRQGSHDRFDRTSDARRSSAATPQHTSRSVTTPISLRCAVSSTTGVQLQPESRIACAACAAVSRGEQHEDAWIGVITSLQQLIVFSSFLL